MKCRHRLFSIYNYQNLELQNPLVSSDQVSNATFFVNLFSDYISVLLVSTGTASTSGTGNCVFADSLSITYSGTYYFTMGSTYGDSFPNLTITNTSTHDVYIGTSDTTFIEGNLILNNTGTGGIVTGNTNGVTYLASGKSIAVGGGGFTKNYLTLKNFYQQGSTAQTLTLTGTAISNLINANFEGNLTVTTPGILLKNSTFSGTTSITRNDSSGSFLARAILFLEIHSENYSARISLLENTSMMDEKVVIPYFSLAPNPANSSCKVYFENIKNDFVLSLKNVLGQTLLETKVAANTHSLEIPLATFDEGMYVVTINDNISIHELKKLIIVR